MQDCAESSGAHMAVPSRCLNGLPERVVLYDYLAIDGLEPKHGALYGLNCLAHLRHWALLRGSCETLLDHPGEHGHLRPAHGEPGLTPLRPLLKECVYVCHIAFE